MPRLIKAGETNPARLQVYFQLVGTDGVTAETGEAGGQPQISINGAAWQDTGIGVLVVIGDGRYYAQLVTSSVANIGDWLETRYKSSNTAECPGDAVEVVGFEPGVAPGTLPPPTAPPVGGNMMKWGQAWNTDQLKAHASDPITYARGYDLVDCRASLGKKLLKLDDGNGGFQIVWTDIDFLIKTSDLDFGDGWVTPEAGDLIYLQTGPYVQTFEVCQFGGEPCWTWADPYQSIRRIHAKYIDIEPYS